ncbi:MAG TPA: DUF1772 domain-containing protein [Methylocella sp.]|nr:DUF1772 domain-containing protein [Methylocella sp.]
MRTRIIAGLAIILTAIALVPAGAHLFSLPNKMSLMEEDYFLAQSLYRGWSLFGLVLIGSLAANASLAILLRGQGASYYLACAAAFCIGLALSIFLTRIYPINQLTNDWTVIPDDWDALRLQWETAHAINAAMTFFALCCVTAATLVKKTEAWS